MRNIVMLFVVIATLLNQTFRREDFDLFVDLPLSVAPRFLLLSGLRGS